MAELAARHWNFETKPFYEDANRQLRLVNDYSWLDVRALEGFPERVREVLGSQAGLPDRAQHVAQAVEWRIGRILAML